MRPVGEATVLNMGPPAYKRVAEKPLRTATTAKVCAPNHQNLSHRVAGSLSGGLARLWSASCDELGGDHVSADSPMLVSQICLFGFCPSALAATNSLPRSFEPKRRSPRLPRRSGEQESRGYVELFLQRFLSAVVVSTESARQAASVKECRSTYSRSAWISSQCQRFDVLRSKRQPPTPTNFKRDRKIPPDE